MNLNYTLTSKRKCLKLVQDNIVDGWDDPRMATLSGMRRRGYPAEAIRDFCERIGVSKAHSVIDFALLEACVRDNLGANSPRAMAVVDPLKLVLNNAEMRVVIGDKHNIDRKLMNMKYLRLFPRCYCTLYTFYLLLVVHLNLLRHFYFRNEI